MATIDAATAYVHYRNGRDTKVTEEGITDLITDLLHLAHTNGIDANKALQQAEDHFSFEVN